MEQRNNKQDRIIFEVEELLNKMSNQVNFLIRKEITMNQLDLDLLMENTRKLYDRLCSVELGADVDTDFDADIDSDSDSDTDSDFDTDTDSDFDTDTDFENADSDLIEDGGDEKKVIIISEEEEKLIFGDNDEDEEMVIIEEDDDDDADMVWDFNKDNDNDTDSDNDTDNDSDNDTDSDLNIDEDDEEDESEEEEMIIEEEVEDEDLSTDSLTDTDIDIDTDLDADSDSDSDSDSDIDTDTDSDIDSEKEEDSGIRAYKVVRENVHTLGDVLEKAEDNSLAARLQRKPVSDLIAAIGINDKFLFLNELFNGSMEKYNKSIRSLNSFSTLLGAKTYMSELQIEFQWDCDTDAYKKLNDLVERRFL